MPTDYKKIGLKCGLEIHQQLDTHKLFCSCPSEIREDEPDIVIKRKMRAVAGELGDIDPAALYEFLKDKEFIYQAYSDTNCLVELDEEPPHELNKEALDIALEISLLLNAKPVDELQIMRKTVIDGSNTSGFQRTVLIALNGFIDTTHGKIRIPTVCLEEDAARKIGDKGNITIYRLDRLGIPLIEIATEPMIASPEHAREVAEKLGMILRMTGKVKRGLGTIRQDLNISVKNGNRIEVKGVQDLKIISKAVESEIERQLMLIGVRDELKKRGVSENDITADSVNITEIFSNTESGIVKDAIGKKGVVLGIKLKGFSNLLKSKLGPELAQYARAIAGVNGIFHSDELPAYGISGDDISEIRKKLDIGNSDAFIIVAEREEIAKSALNSVVGRCKAAFTGVPEETRKAMNDGRSEFMRPLPGSARMYPETDEPLTAIGGKKIAEIQRKLPELPEDKLGKFIKMGLSSELANQLIRSKFIDAFEKFSNEFRTLKPSVIATTLISAPKDVKKRYGVDPGNLTIKNYNEILSMLNANKISKDAIPEIIAELAKTPEGNLESIIKEKNLGLLSIKELEGKVDGILKENPELVKRGDKAINILLGRVMSELRGRADIETIKSILAEKLKNCG